MSPRLLIKSGMNIKTNPKDHHTMFRMAIYAKSPRMVKLLIELGADPKAKNNMGATPLDTARQFKADDQIIKLLSTK